MPEYQALTTELLESVHNEGMGASLVSTPAVFSLTVSYMVCETACMHVWLEQLLPVQVSNGGSIESPQRKSQYQDTKFLIKFESFLL